MSEIDNAWAQFLQEAERRARTTGRGDVAEYLVLRQTNDAARRFGIEWLLAAFARLAGDANRTANQGVRLEQAEDHEFRVGNSTMKGMLLTLRAGTVRVVRLEAGWPRTPADGIVPGGGLARARISHFGDAKANDELMLVYAPASNTRENPSGTPQWLALEDAGARTPLTEDRLRRHITKLRT